MEELAWRQTKPMNTKADNLPGRHDVYDRFSSSMSICQIAFASLDFRLLISLWKFCCSKYQKIYTKTFSAIAPVIFSKLHIVLLSHCQQPLVPIFKLGAEVPRQIHQHSTHFCFMALSLFGTHISSAETWKTLKRVPPTTSDTILLASVIFNHINSVPNYTKFGN